MAKPTAKQKAIASHIQIAYYDAQSAKRLTGEDRNAVKHLFTAAENLVLAVLASEDVPSSLWRSQAGNHQIDRMIDFIPDECSMKEELRSLSPLVMFATTYRYPTPSGGVPMKPRIEDFDKWQANVQALIKGFCRQFGVDPRIDKPVAKTVRPFRENNDTPKII